jgi:MFS transporter, DHA1 family, multidrug resistance protein
MTAPAPAPPDLSPPNPWRVVNLLAQIAFGLLAMTICLPSMPSWAATFQASSAAVQLSFSAYVLAYGGMQLVYGPWSDRIGRRSVLLVGLALALLGSLGAALAPSLGWLVLARMLQGAGSAAGMVVGRAMVQDLFQGPQRTRVMAYIGMTLGLCPPLATIVGGQLHVWLGWRSNFAVMALLAALLWWAAWRGLPGHVRSSAPSEGLRGLWRAYGQLARAPAFLRYVAVLAMTTATFYAFLGGAPAVLAHYGVGPQGVGFYIMTIPLAYIVGNYLTSHWVHRAGERRIMRLGQGLTLLGLLGVVLLALAGWHSPMALALPLVVVGVGHGLLVPPTLAGTVGLLPALAGAAAAVAGLMQQLMGALGSYLVGLLPHHSALPLGLLMLGCALLASGALSGLHPPQRATPPRRLG